MIELMTKVRHGMNKLLSTIAAIILITMSVLVIYQVFTRYVLNSPADFTEEIIRYLLIWICFIGAAYAELRPLHGHRRGASLRAERGDRQEKADSVTNRKESVSWQNSKTRWSTRSIPSPSPIRTGTVWATCGA